MKERILILSNSKKGEILKNHLLKRGKNVLIFDGYFGIEEAENIKPDFVISYGYAKIVPKETIKYLEGNIINAHPSLLPLNRGSFPNFWSFIYNTAKGVTIHNMDEGIDTGDILLQREFHFDKFYETFNTTYNIIEDETVKLLDENINNFVNHKITPHKQQGISTYHSLKKFRKFSEQIDFDWNVNIAEFLSLNRNKIEEFLNSFCDY